VIPNMNMQIAATIRPVRMFFLARRRFMRRLEGYNFASATIAQNSSAR
jgi:hypothetical protein